MAIDDLWYLSKRGSDGERVPSKRHARGKRWRVRWTDPNDARPRTELFGKLSDAQRHDASVRNDISRGRYVDPRAGTVTVAEYAQAWRAQQLHRDTTASRVECSIRLHIVPILGELPLNQVKPSHLRTWVKDRVEVLDAVTVRSVFGVIRAMLDAAVLDKLIGTNPCAGIRLPEVDHGDMFVPTAEQVHAIATELPDRYRAAVYLAAGCGLRFGEVFGLEPEHVAFLHREVTVAQQIKRVGKRGRYIGPTKTRTSRRVVELPTVVADAVASHLERYPAITVALDDESGKDLVHRPVKLLFTTGFGTPVTSSAWSVVWRSAVKRAKLPATGFTLHSLRHFVSA